MNQGWIKIHRQIDKRGRRHKPNTFSLFLYLLTNANSEDKNYQGHLIKRGDCVVGRKSLSKILGMTEDQIRTSITHLKSTNEITIKTTNKFSVITVCKWEEYQIQEKISPAKPPAVSPTNPQQIPTPKEYKNIDIIYISDKKMFIDIVDKEYIENWKGALKILWLLIEKGYKIEKKKKDVEDFVEWISNKSRTTFGLSQIGEYLWSKTQEAVEDCMEYHKNDKALLTKQSYKSKIATWFGRHRDGFNNKK